MVKWSSVEKGFLGEVAKVLIPTWKFYALRYQIESGTKTIKRNAMSIFLVKFTTLQGANKDTRSAYPSTKVTHSLCLERVVL